jgi:hypothetical protein
MLQAEDIIKVGGRPDAVKQHWPAIVEALKAQRVDTPEMRLVTAATILVEVGKPFKPRTERRADPLLQPDIARMQARYFASGFCGRGFLQHTWRKEYERLAESLGAPLVENPELLNRSDLAAKALVLGLVDRGVPRLADACDWQEIRRRINGSRMLGLQEFVNYMKALSTALIERERTANDQTNQ